MPDPLSSRVLAAVKTKVAELSAPDVAAAKVFSREKIDFDPPRDGTPSVIVCRTPETPVVRRHRIGWRDIEYPITVVLFDAGDQGLKPPVTWRDKWRDTVADQLAGSKLTGVTECKKVWVDDGVTLDLAAWEQANLFSAQIHLRVMCRISARA